MVGSANADMILRILPTEHPTCDAGRSVYFPSRADGGLDIEILIGNL
jgi:hypothetical protein